MAAVASSQRAVCAALRTTAVQQHRSAPQRAARRQFSVSHHSPLRRHAPEGLGRAPVRVEVAEGLLGARFAHPSPPLQVEGLYNPVPTIKSLLPVFKISHILELGVTHPLVQVDELYNHRTRLVCSAAAPPDQLFAGADHSEPIIDLEQLQVGSCCSCLVLLFI